MNYEKNKLGIVGTVGVPAKYGGFETLVHHLVKNLHNEFDITVYCSEKAYSEEERVSEWNGAKLKYIPLNANGAQSIFYDLWSTIDALRHNDQVLILGVSGCIFLPLLKLFFSQKIVVNIDGLEWRRPKWNWLTRMFLLFSEMVACYFADEIVTDNRILKEYVKIRYGRVGNLIEYGSDHNAPVEAVVQDLDQYPFLEEEYAFKVSRIEPENNIEMILRAFSRQKNQRLVLVGNWENSSYGKDLKSRFHHFPNLFLIDPIYDLQTLNLLRSNATYYVHGHSAGGTNPSLVEAMYLNLPVLTFDVIYNRVTTNNQAIYFTDSGELEHILKHIHHQPLQMVAQNLKTYADRMYTWANIAARYAAVFGHTIEIVQPSNYKGATFSKKPLETANHPSPVVSKMEHSF